MLVGPMPVGQNVCWPNVFWLNINCLLAKMSVSQISAYQTIFNQISVGKMFVSQEPVDQMSVG
jgi:hypothetical protein